MLRMTKKEAQATTEQPPAPSPKRKRGRQGKVTLFPNWCKGCGLCIEFCPKNVLEQTESDGIFIARPEECTACRWCELHCPDFAVFVTEVETEEAE
jgi:2-oxoglutarate ferredoxin oxidoreductase subunit delta